MALGAVVLAPEMRQWDKSQVQHVQAGAACASFMFIGLPLVWLIANGRARAGLMGGWRVWKE